MGYHELYKHCCLHLQNINSRSSMLISRCIKEIVLLRPRHSNTTCFDAIDDNKFLHLIMKELHV
jgi:hypothetical protein